MPELSFQVVSAAAVPYSVAPLLVFKLQITNADAKEVIQSIGLRCQIQIESTQRKYAEQEQEKLLDLFGEPERWSRTLRPMLWTHASVAVSQFKESIAVELPVPCSFDFNVAVTKYFDALEDGDVPLNLMFSGTVFYESAGAALQVEQISWDKECRFRLPVRVWKEMMDVYYPNSAWLCLHRDVFDKLAKYKMDRGIPTWEQALEGLLANAGAAEVRIEPRSEDEIVVEGSVPS